MTQHEKTLYEELESLILSNKKSGRWTLRKIIGAILLATSLLGGGGYAYKYEAKIVENYVHAEDFKIAQEAQDSIVNLHMTDTTARIDRVQRTVERNGELTQRIAGKLGVNIND